MNIELFKSNAVWMSGGFDLDGIDYYSSVSSRIVQVFGRFLSLCYAFKIFL
jgi:hypothetical protein